MAGVGRTAGMPAVGKCGQQREVEACVGRRRQRALMPYPYLVEENTTQARLTGSSDGWVLMANECGPPW